MNTKKIKVSKRKKALHIADVIKSVCGCGKIGEYSKKFDKVLCDECFDELLSQTVL